MKLPHIVIFIFISDHIIIFGSSAQQNFGEHKMNTQKLLILVLVISTLNGCATLSKEDCLQGDWKTIGYNDGAQGYTLSRLTEHQQACTEYGVKPDLVAYQAGHAEGLVYYCQPNNGFKLGEQVANYSLGLCPANLETAFLLQYVLGLDGARRLAEAEIDAQYSKLHRKASQLASANNEEMRKTLQRDVDTLESTINESEGKRVKIIELLMRIRSKMY